MARDIDRCGRCRQAIDQLKRQLLCLACQRDLLEAFRNGRVAPPAPYVTPIGLEPQPAQAIDYGMIPRRSRGYAGGGEIRGRFSFQPGELDGIVEPLQFEWMG